MLIPDRFFWIAFVLVILLIMFGAVLGKSHGTQLSDVGVLTEVELAGCGDGTYVVQSKEQRCSLIYKTTDLTGSHINIKRIPLNEDGECACPEGFDQ